MLPDPPQLPPGVSVPFAWVRVRGTRAYIAGHGALNTDGTPAGPFGKVEADVSVEQGYQAARQTAQAVLASLKRDLVFDLWHLGTRWTDRFRPSELAPAWVR